MRSLFGNKRWILLFAVLALGALTVLATTLNEVPFRGAQRFSQEERGAPAMSTGPAWEQASPEDDVLVWMLIGLMVILIALILSPELRKKMLKLLIRVAVTVWIVLFVIRNYGDRLLEAAPAAGDGGSPAPRMAPPASIFEPPEVSSPFSYVVSFIVALLWLAVIWAVYRGWKKYSQLRSMQPLDELARIARSSLDDLSSGRNSSDVIINCYLRMSDVVSHKRALQRAAAMTPHEFALRLEQAGLPGDAVRRLTRLFEAVRYGDRKSGPKDVNEAVSCLQTILHYCGEPV